MSSLAFFLKLNNIEVSGSDIGQDPIIKKLKKIGCTIYGLHSSENIKNPDLIIYSSAIKENNPELIKAKKNKINILKRGKALGLFTNKMKNITITGCHGKSTTTSISNFILNKSHIDPTTFLVLKIRFLDQIFTLENQSFV